MTNLEPIEEVLLGGNCSLDRICAELAKLFGVRNTEVGMLRLEGELLRFVYPVELQTAGCIPISGSAVASKTAITKKAELFNNFANVPHRTVFELVKLKDPELKDPEPEDPKQKDQERKDPEPKSDDHSKIQKLMSAPILGEQYEVLGVVQVSKKGVTPYAAGPDFTDEELHRLERTARRVAALRPEILLTDPKKPRWKLELQNEQRKSSKPERPPRHRSPK